MRRVGFLALCGLLVAACTGGGSSPTSGSGSESSVSSSTSPAPPSSSTTHQVAEPFHLFAGHGYDLDVFRAGLIASEEPTVDELFLRSPLYEADLSIRPDLTGFDGNFSVRVVNNEEDPLSEVVFRLFPNVSDGVADVFDLAVDGSAVEPLYSLQRSVMTIPLADPLPPGDSVLVEAGLAVTVPIDEGGKYGTFLLDEGILALAHALPLIAVYDDEGWNTEIAPPSGDSVYSEAGFFLVRLSAAPELTLVTSGSLVATEMTADGAQAGMYAAGPARDFYIATSADLALLQAEVGETTINSYAPARFGERSQMVLDAAVSSMRVFEDLYGAYPYTEMDLVSTRTLALGVEYPGAIAMAMGHYDPDAGFDDPTILSTVVHEVAHQWFYGTVGNDQLDEPWLDEAMAQYATWKWWGITQGEGAAEGFASHLQSRWDRVERADIPIGLPVASYQGAEYGAIVYGRGPLEIGNLAGPMGGQEELDGFLRSYAEHFKYGVVATTEFQAAAEEWCGCDLSDEFAAVVYPR